MQLAGERNVSGKTPVAGDQWLVFQACHRAADKTHDVYRRVVESLRLCSESLPRAATRRNASGAIRYSRPSGKVPASQIPAPVNAAIVTKAARNASAISDSMIACRAGASVAIASGP